jgi:hypothetical protein
MNNKPSLPTTLSAVKGKLSLPTINMLYANLQYAEIPQLKIPEVIEKSYRPIFKGLLKRKNTHMLLGITGWTAEYLNKNHKDILELIQKCVDSGIVQIMGGTYTNSVLPIIPKSSQVKQIETHQKIIKKLFKVEPSGFCLSEMAWDPSLSTVLDKFGYNWALIPYHLIQFSRATNEKSPFKEKRWQYSGEIGARILEKPIFYKLFSLYPLYKSFKRELYIFNHNPFLIDAVSDKTIGIVNNRSWTAYINLVMAGKGLQTWASLKARLSKQSKRGKGLFVPYFADIENIGFDGGNSPLNIKVERFFKFLDLLEKMNFEYVWPQDYLKNNKTDQKIYVKAGSGEPSATLDIWTEDPDNKVLNSLCNQIREKISHEKEGTKKEKAWQLLMLAENCDGRGWNPVPEKRIQCFQYAEQALKLFE